MTPRCRDLLTAAPMPNTVFECGNEKCAYAIDASALNAIQLKALRMWKKTCPQCGQQTHWQEKLPLLNTETLKTPNGGQNASLSKVTTKSASQKRKAARYTGH